MDGLDGAAAELEDASCVTGCIALAAAAGPNLQEAAAGVNLASIWLGSRSEALDTGCTPAHRAAGECMSAAALAMKEAARSLHDAGARLESGEWGERIRSRSGPVRSLSKLHGGCVSCVEPSVSLRWQVYRGIHRKGAVYLHTSPQTTHTCERKNSGHCTVSL